MNQFTSHQLDNMTTLISLLNKITNERFDHSNFSMIGEPLCALGHGYFLSGCKGYYTEKEYNYKRYFTRLYASIMSFKG